jgi:hypothetical protein
MNVTVKMMSIGMVETTEQVVMNVMMMVKMKMMMMMTVMIMLRVMAAMMSKAHYSKERAN